MTIIWSADFTRDPIKSRVVAHVQFTPSVQIYDRIVEVHRTDQRIIEEHDSDDKITEVL